MKALLAVLLLATSTAFGQGVSQFGIPVLEYHHVVTEPSKALPLGTTVVTLSAFSNQMQWLHDNGYVTLTAAELATYMLDPTSSKLPEKSKVVVISFDDGWSDQLQAVPVLRSFGFTATFSIISGLADTPDYMKWSEIKELANKGFDIESHSVTHPDRMAEVAASNEIIQSKEAIETHIHQAVKIMTWPNGYFTNEMLSIAVKAGYIGALTIDQTWCEVNTRSLEGWLSCDHRTGNFAFQNPLFMKRVFIDGTCSVEKFSLEVTEAHSTDCSK